jgi:serine/threonine protein kinase
MEHEIASKDVKSPLSEQDLRRIASAKDAFRIACENNEHPEIEAYVSTFPAWLKEAALAELLSFEVGFRRAAGGTCSLADYTSRFPEYVETVSKLLHQSPASETHPTGEVTVKEASSEMDEDDPLKKDAEDHKSKADGSDELKDVPEQFGRYKILRELGRGGMGAVFLALDGQLGRNVALKIPFFRDDDEKEAVERFYREARAMAMVQHANLCPVFDVGRFERWHFLTMAFIDGQPLSKVLKGASFLSVPQAAALMKTVAIAVQKAHEVGIVHRDLKPANIMLNKDGDPIIMDFGLARRKSSGEVDLTQAGAIFGSPAYMAPEQVEAKHDAIGPATDVYALGVILYQMVTGQRPFQGSVMSIFGQIVSKVPDPPSKWRPNLPPEVDSICLKALEKSPSERHASAAKFAEELSYLVNPVGNDVKTISYHTRPDIDSVAGAEMDSTSNNRSRRDAELRHVTVAVFNYEGDGDEGSISVSRASMSSQSELLHEQSQSFAAFVNEEAAQLGGVVVRGAGQEVLICFGFPQAFEDAPQRAIRAALQVMRKLAAPDSKGMKLPLASQAWVLLHSGEAVAEEANDPQGAGVSLVGEARNTALRLSGIVEPGTVVISTATHQRVSLYFECESLGTQRVRGIAQPVELFKVNKEAASRNRVELVDPGNLSPLVGRDTELSILKDRWEQAQDGLGQTVLMIGDAGLGKSRLIRELREYVIGADTEGASVIEWRCAQHQQGTSFFPVVDFLTRLFDFENHSAADRWERSCGTCASGKLNRPRTFRSFAGYSELTPTVVFQLSPCLHKKSRSGRKSCCFSG